MKSLFTTLRRMLDEPLVQGLTTRYLGALLAIATLAFVSQLLIQSALSKQDDVTRYIRAANQQRLAGEALRRDALALQLASHRSDLSGALRRLAAGAKTFREAHAILSEQRSSGRLTEAYRPMETALRELERVAPASTFRGRRSPTLLVAARAIVDKGSVYLAALDDSIVKLEREAASRVRELRWIEGLLFVLTLVVLVIEGLYVFRPSVRKLRQAMTDLQISEARKRAILEKAPEAVVTFDHRGHVMELNPTAQRLFATDSEAAVGKPLADLLRAPPEFLVYFSPYETEGGASRLNTRFELPVKRVSGEDVQIEGVVVPILGNGFPLFTAFFKDITKRKTEEEALKRSLEELSRSNEDLERFAYVASHDLQEPLRMIHSYIALLSKRYHGRLDEDADEFIGFASEGAKRMRRLIQDLLSFSRLSKAPPKADDVNCDTTLKNVLTDLHCLVAETNTSVEVEGPLPVVRGEASQVRQLFQNLVANAIKFRGERAPAIRIGCAEEHDGWKFYVSDNGIGMDSTHSGKIFEVFQRLHSQDEYPGSGLGLAICKRIVEAHGGKIWVESQPQQGSTFYFTLPGACEASPDVMR